MRREALVQVKVTVAERRRWHEAAEREERTVSELVREAMRQRIAREPAREQQPRSS